MESNPLRGLFGVSSPRPVEQRVAPQPAEPTENDNVYFEIRSGMIEKLLADPFLGDGTKHPNEHLIYVDEVWGLFKLVGVPEDVVKKKVFSLSLKEDALIWYRLCDTRSWDCEGESITLCILFIVITIIYIISGLAKEKA